MGERVAQIADKQAVPAGISDGEIKWDYKNGRGVDVVNGTYIVRAEIEYLDGSKETKIYKIVVIK